MTFTLTKHCWIHSICYYNFVTFFFSLILEIINTSLVEWIHPSQSQFTKVNNLCSNYNIPVLLQTCSYIASRVYLRTILRKNVIAFPHLIPLKAPVLANIYIIFASHYYLLITLLRIMLSSSSRNKNVPVRIFREFIPCCFSTFIVVEKTRLI